MDMEKQTKNSLILRVYEKTPLQRKDIQTAVNAFFDVMAESLQRGETVEIRGLGVFSLGKRNKRMRYNFQTNTVMETSEQAVIEFTPSKTLRIRLNEHCMDKKMPNKLENEAKK